MSFANGLRYAHDYRAHYTKIKERMNQIIHTNAAATTEANRNRTGFGNLFLMLPRLN